MPHHTPVIVTASPEDTHGIAEVLHGAKLPAEAIAEHLDGFFVARENGRVVGCVALEQYGDTGILRSLAVAPQFRGRHLGVRLAEHLIERARERRVSTLVLLTETARDFFERKLGFEVVDRGVVSQTARQSWQFTGAVCQSATCMRRKLGPA